MLVGIAPVVVGSGVVGIESDDLVEIVYGAVIVLVIAVGEPPFIICTGILRISINGFSKGLYCSFIVLLLILFTSVIFPPAYCRLNKYEKSSAGQSLCLFSVENVQSMLCKLKKNESAILPVWI